MMQFMILLLMILVSTFEVLTVHGEETEDVNNQQCCMY